MAKATATLTGVEKTMRDLNDELQKWGMVTTEGLLKAAIFIRRDMDSTAPMIPVDLGNLRASSYVATKTKVYGATGGFKGPDSPNLASGHGSAISSARAISMGSGKYPSVVLGFSAHYAGIVEGMSGVKWKRPGSGSHFFESALTRNAGVILTIVQKEGMSQFKRR